MASIDADLSGRTAVVTGATGGIGKEIARGLARIGAHVVIGARNLERGNRVRDELAADAKGGVSVLELDVAHPASVRAFAAELARRHDRLHILVNNAGAWFSDRRETRDGHEITFATNVLGPHLLTRLVEPQLRAGAPSRIVNVVSSIAGNYDATDLEWRRRAYDGFKVYGQSKLALRMITWGQARRLDGSGVTANAAAPGFVKTDFNQNARGFVAAMLGLSAKLFAVSPEKGADTPLWVAAAPELTGRTGRYFTGRKEKDGRFRDPEAIADLERRCDELVAVAARAA